MEEAEQEEKEKQFVRKKMEYAKREGKDSLPLVDMPLR